MIGQIISHYRITRQLGAGGMGVVYEAEDTNLKRTVALKFLPPGSTRDPEAKARFQQEAQAASALDHPNVCNIHEIGETADGQLFLVMARYEGQTLKERIARGPLPIADALDISRQIAAGLAKAHAQGIVHRDIKPGNLFVTEDGLLKILDFGLAKLADETRLTRPGATLGTVGYMSPEQVRGEDVDHRSDLWSLGVVLYEMVTGRLPFMGDGPQAVMNSILTREPDPVTGLRTGVPMELERIIGKSLAKEPSERYQHAEDLLADVSVLQRQVGVLSGSTMAAGVMARNRSRRGLWAIGVVAAVIVGGLAAVVVFGSARKHGIDEAERTLAIVDFRDLEAPDDVSTAAGVIELMNISMIENCPIRVISPEYLRDVRRRLFGSGRGPIEDDQVMQVAREAGATLFLAGRIGHMGDERYVTWRLVDTSSGTSIEARKVDGIDLAGIVDRIVADVIPVVEAACGIEQAHASVSPVENISTVSPEAYEHFVAGMLAKERNAGYVARDELEKAVAIDSEFALAYLELGKLYLGLLTQLKDMGKAVSLLGEADRRRDRLGQKDRLRLDAAFFDDRREFARSITVYEEILERWPDDRSALIDLLNLRYRYWDFRDALAVSQQGLKYYPDDIGTFGSMEVNLLRLLGRRRDALAKALDNSRLLPQDANAWDDLAAAWLAVGQPDSALVAARKTLEVDPSFGDGSRLPEVFFVAGDLKGAIASTRAYLEDTRLPDSARRWRMVATTAGLGLAALYCEAGQFQQALGVVEEARRYSRGNPSGTAFQKGQILLRTGDPAEAMRIALAMLQEYDDARAPFYSLRIQAHAAVALGDLSRARSAVNEILEADAKYGIHAKMIALAVQAEIALAEHRPDAALALLDDRSALGDDILTTTGIDLHTARADAYRQAGRLEEAVQTHLDLLKVCGGHALSHYALGGLYEEMGRTQDAAAEYGTFLDMWSKADERLPQLMDARTRLAALESAQ